MIAEHQPDIFDKERLQAAVSSSTDGNQGLRVRGAAETDDDIRHNRRRFLARNGAAVAQTALVYVTYDEGRNFQTIRVVSDEDLGRGLLDPGKADVADGLITNRTDVALYLPLADCNGAILHDEVSQAFGVFHLGRHSTIRDTARYAVERMQATFGTKPENIKAWISPGIGRDSYPMQRVPGPGHFDFATDARWQDFRRIDGDTVFIDLAGYNAHGFTEAGVLPHNIEVSTVDTAQSSEYPSHNKGDTSRFAILAMQKHTA